MTNIKVLVVGAVVLVALGPGLPTLSLDDLGGGKPAPSGRDPQPRAEPAASAPSDQAARTCARMAAPWGSNSASGTPDEPVRGPRRLVAMLRPGQTGCLRSGTYRETQIQVKRPRVTLRSAPGERATWRGRIVLMGARDRLLGLNLDGSAGPRCGASNCGALPSPTINAPNVVVADNDIQSPDSGICVHPRAWGRQRPDHFLIERNRIHDCGRRPPTEHDHGIYVADGRGGVIRDNVVFGNADRGIQLYPDAYGTTVIDNTVDGNGSGIVFSERSAKNVVRNNVFSNAVRRWNAESYQLSGRGNAFVGNCVRPGNANSTYDVNGGIALPSWVSQSGNRAAGTKLYVDRASGDFRIAPGSACTGRGATDSVAGPLGG